MYFPILLQIQNLVQTINFPWNSDIMTFFLIIILIHNLFSIAFYCGLVFRAILSNKIQIPKPFKLAFIIRIQKLNFIEIVKEIVLVNLLILSFFTEQNMVILHFWVSNFFKIYWWVLCYFNYIILSKIIFHFKIDYKFGIDSDVYMICLAYKDNNCSFWRHFSKLCCCACLKLKVDNRVILYFIFK